MKQIETERFGKLSIDKKSIITFFEGLIGFRDLKQFVIVGVEDYLPFMIFSSLDRSRHCFPIIDPLPFFPEYHPKLRGIDLDNLEVDNTEDIQIYCLTAFAGEPRKTYVNMRNPLVINVARMIGIHADLKVKKYHARTPFDINAVALRAHR